MSDIYYLFSLRKWTFPPRWTKNSATHLTGMRLFMMMSRTMKCFKASFFIHFCLRCCLALRCETNSFWSLWNVYHHANVNSSLRPRFPFKASGNNKETDVHKTLRKCLKTFSSCHPENGRRMGFFSLFFTHSFLIASAIKVTKEEGKIANKILPDTLWELSKDEHDNDNKTYRRPC